MKFPCPFVALVLLDLLPPLAADPAHVPLGITHAALWSEPGILADHEIVIRDGFVAAVGKSGATIRPPVARVIDAGGDTLLPGANF